MKNNMITKTTSIMGAIWKPMTGSSCFWCVRLMGGRLFVMSGKGHFGGNLGDHLHGSLDLLGRGLAVGAEKDYQPCAKGGMRKLFRLLLKFLDECLAVFPFLPKIGHHRLS